jgi:hypothetical protein
LALIIPASNDRNSKAHTPPDAGALGGVNAIHRQNRPATYSSFRPDTAVTSPT